MGVGMLRVKGVRVEGKEVWEVVLEGDSEIAKKKIGA
jgi:hypothetical protein